VLTDDKKRAAHRALQDRILNGAARASPELRARAVRNAGLSEPLEGLLGKVAARPAQVKKWLLGKWVISSRGCRRSQWLPLGVSARSH
jgi:hypothetical protein